MPKHIIVVPKKLNTTFEKMYVAAVARAMGVEVPSKIKIVTSETESKYVMTGYRMTDLKKERLEVILPELESI